MLRVLATGVFTDGKLDVGHFAVRHRAHRPMGRLHNQSILHSLSHLAFAILANSTSKSLPAPFINTPMRVG